MGSVDAELEAEAAPSHLARMQRELRQEVHEVLRQNLQTRLARHRAKLALASTCPEAPSPQVVDPPTPLAAKAKVQMRDARAQAGPGQLDAAPAGSRHALHEAVLKALSSQRPSEERGFLAQSAQQRRNEIRAPYRGDDAFNDDGQSVKETLTLKTSLENLQKLVGQRGKQVQSLLKQVDYVKEHLKEDVAAAGRARASREALERDPSQAAQLRLQRLEQRRKRVKELESELSTVQEQKSTSYQLARQQQTFLRQKERIQIMGGFNATVRRNKAGDLFLEPRPVPVPDCEAAEIPGIESSFANPYEVDSFPFEPNVLATKPAKNFERELALHELEEETAEELAEAMRSPSNPVRMDLRRRLQLGGVSDDDAPPPESARSF